jgi:superfamily II DNA helicase RecQ
MSKMVMRKIRNSEFTHISLSPELANSPEFSNVATDPFFKSRVGLVVVYELHVVKQWGCEFRKQYGRLSSRRWKLGTGIPWFGITATLPDKTLEVVKKSVVFKEDVRVIRTSVDRPEISLIIQQIEQNKTKTFEGLYFVLDTVINSSKTGDLRALSGYTEDHYIL